HHVMVAAAVELGFVTGSSVRKRHGAGQATLGQQLERAGDGGENDFSLNLFSQAEKIVGGKMVAGIEERPQEGVARPGMLEADASQMLVKDVLGLAHGFARGRSVVVNASLQHGRQRPSVKVYAK